MALLLALGRSKLDLERTKAGAQVDKQDAAGDSSLNGASWANRDTAILILLCCADWTSGYPAADALISPFKCAEAVLQALANFTIATLD
jgi:hypothetical protein